MSLGSEVGSCGARPRLSHGSKVEQHQFGDPHFKLLPLATFTILWPSLGHSALRASVIDWFAMNIFYLGVTIAIYH